MSYLAAGLEVLALGVDALVVINVVLPAMLGLVDVGETGVDTYISSHQKTCLNRLFRCRGSVGHPNPVTVAICHADIVFRIAIVYRTVYRIVYRSFIKVH